MILPPAFNLNSIVVKVLFYLLLFYFDIAKIVLKT
nr:MAG TPA: hypothetical protein [Caudoviricetes sp.]